MGPGAEGGIGAGGSLGGLLLGDENGSLAGLIPQVGVVDVGVSCIYVRLYEGAVGGGVLCVCPPLRRPLPLTCILHERAAQRRAGAALDQNGPRGGVPREERDALVADQAEGPADDALPGTNNATRRSCWGVYVRMCVCTCVL